MREEFFHKMQQDSYLNFRLTRYVLYDTLSQAKFTEFSVHIDKVKGMSPVDLPK